MSKQLNFPPADSNKVLCGMREQIEYNRKLLKEANKEEGDDPIFYSGKISGLESAIEIVLSVIEKQYAEKIRKEFADAR